MSELTLDELNARASEMTRASAASADSVIVRVSCAGETKAIELPLNGTVRAAIDVCRRKFKFKVTDGFQLYLAFPADVQLKDSELLARYKLKFNDELDFKLPKGLSPPAHAHPPRAFTQTYTTEARSSPALAPRADATADTGSLTKSASVNHVKSSAAAAVAASAAVGSGPGSGPGSAVASPTLQRLDPDATKRKLELALAEILTLRHDRDKAVADRENAQLLLLAEKEKTEKLLAAVRKAQADAAAATAASAAPVAPNSSGELVTSLQAEVARLRSELDTKMQVIAEQQHALDEYCADETAGSAAAAVPVDSVELERLQAQLAVANHDNEQLSARAAALEERLAKMVSVVTVLMEQNKQLKDRLGGQ